MRAELAALVLAAGCGRIGFDAGADASFDATPDVYATGMFSTPTIVAALTSAARDDDVTVTDDLLELYFASDRPGGAGLQDIYRSTRTSPVVPWGPPVNVAELNTNRTDLTPEIAGDGLSMYLVSNRSSLSAMDMNVFRTVRSSRDATWSIPVPVDELHSTDAEFSATEDRVGTTLYLQRNPPSGADIYAATRAAVTDRWSAPQPVTELNTVSGSETDPFPTPLGLYFTSTRSASTFRPYFATAAGAGFDPPMVVTELDSPQQEQDIWVSPDGRYVMFASDRSGNFEIYEATR